MKYFAENISTPDGFKIHVVLNDPGDAKELVVLLHGITVGRGAVVGANAVVTKPVPDFHRVLGTNVMKRIG